MVRLVAVKPFPKYTVWIKYEDGVEGTVDLSHLVGKGVFAAWKNPRAFEQVRIGDSGELLLDETLALCPDALYLRLTGKSPEQLFLVLQQAHA